MNESNPAKSTLEMLEQGVKEVFQSQRYKEYLTAVSKFHHYSYGNIMLILMQCPHATRVAGMRTFNELGRVVKKGEKSINILAPMITKVKLADPADKEKSVLHGFRVVHVFDISQTIGQDLPSLTTEIQGNVADYDTMVNAIIQVAECPVTFEEIPGSTKGFYSPGAHRIVVSSELSNLHSIKTLLHELAHSRLHRRGQANKEIKDHSTKEVEAESVAFVVSQHLGLDTGEYSFDYLANWSSDEQMKELKAALPLIQKTANDLISELDYILIPNAIPNPQPVAA